MGKVFILSGRLILKICDLDLVDDLGLRMDLLYTGSIG